MSKAAIELTNRTIIFLVLFIVLVVVIVLLGMSFGSAGNETISSFGEAAEVFCIGECPPCC